MKNIISVMILMIGLFVSMASGNQVTASSRHPEFVSVSSEIASASYPETTISATATSTVEATVGDPSEPVKKDNFFLKNWGALLFALLTCADVVTRLTPTEKDNSILNFITSVINAIIPNLKKGGGRL